MFWRMSEFHHLPHAVWPLKVGAVDEEQRLLYSSLQQVSVDGYHPAVQAYATPERERKRERERERERKGRRKHLAITIMSKISPLIPLGVVAKYLCSLM